eukprot:2521182-Prymnesium_polylepis.1
MNVEFSTVSPNQAGVSSPRRSPDSSGALGRNEWSHAGQLRWCPMNLRPSAAAEIVKVVCRWQTPNTGRVSKEGIKWGELIRNGDCGSGAGYAVDKYVATRQCAHLVPMSLLRPHAPRSLVSGDRPVRMPSAPSISTPRSLLSATTASIRLIAATEPM